MLQLPLVIIAVIAGLFLGVLGNWVYDLLKSREILSTNPTRKRFTIILLAFLPIIALVALPELLSTPLPFSSDPASSLEIENSGEVTPSVHLQRGYQSVRLQQGQMVAVVSSEGIALIRFMFNPDGAAYQWRYRERAASLETEGSGLLYENYELTPVATSEYLVADSGSQLEIAIEDMQLLWSSGGSTSGWLYYDDQVLAVEIHSDTDYSTFDLALP